MKSIKIAFLILIIAPQILAMRPKILPFAKQKPTLTRFPAYQKTPWTGLHRQKTLWGVAREAQSRSLSTKVIGQCSAGEKFEIPKEQQDLFSVVPPYFAITPGVDDEKFKQLRLFKDNFKEEKSLYLLYETFKDTPSSGQSKWDKMLYAIYKQVADEIKEKNIDAIQKIAQTSGIVKDGFASLAIEELFSHPNQTFDKRKEQDGKDLNLRLFFNIINHLVKGTEFIFNDMLKTSKNDVIDKTSQKMLYDHALDELQKISNIGLAMARIYDGFDNSVSRLFLPFESLEQKMKKTGSFSQQDIINLRNSYEKTAKMMVTPAEPPQGSLAAFKKFSEKMEKEGKKIPTLNQYWAEESSDLQKKLKNQTPALVPSTQLERIWQSFFGKKNF